MINIDPNKKTEYARKRSSLKVKHLIDDMQIDEIMNHKAKKLQWDAKVDEVELTKKDDNQHSDNKMKFKETKTHFQDLDPADDVYLHKLHEINQIKPTKEVVDEIVELVDEKEQGMNEEEAADDNMNPKFNVIRKRSIKDEFSVAKELLNLKVSQDEELAAELIEETMKNTLYNKCVCKFEHELSDDEMSDQMSDQ